MRRQSALFLGVVLLAAACSRSGFLDDEPTRPTPGGSSPTPMSDAGPAADAPSLETDASQPADATPPQRWSCPGFSGVEVNAPWPVVGRCPDRTSASPVLGPTSTPKVAWTNAAIQFGRRSALVIGADGTIYVGSADGLTALAPDGTAKWSAPISVNDLALGRSGLVYARATGSLNAYEADGSVAWSVPLQDAQDAQLPTCSGDVGIALGADESVIAGDCSGKMVCFGPDGKQRWSTSLPKYPSPMTPAIAPSGTVEVAGVSFATGAPWNGRLFSLDINGAILTSSPILSFEGFMFGFDSPAVGADGTAYMPMAAGVTAIASDGSAAWEATLFAPFTTPALGPDGTVFSVDRGGHTLYAIAPDGSTSWSYPGPIDPYLPPVIGGDGTVYIGVGVPGSQTTGNTTVALSADGTVEWELPGGGDPLAIGADGTLYTRSVAPTLGTLSALKR